MIAIRHLAWTTEALWEKRGKEGGEGGECCFRTLSNQKTSSPGSKLRNSMQVGKMSSLNLKRLKWT